MTVLFIAMFFVASAGLAHRLRFARRARECLYFTPFVVGAWAALLTSRKPTPIGMTINFLFLDMTIMLLAVTGIFRMLGAFDEPQDSDTPPPQDLPGESKK